MGMDTLIFAACGPAETSSFSSLFLRPDNKDVPPVSTTLANSSFLTSTSQLEIESWTRPGQDNGGVVKGDVRELLRENIKPVYHLKT
jgi:hypothetical protein